MDGSAGLSGDMFLGGLLDLGYPEARLREVVASFGAPVSVSVAEGSRGSFRGRSVTVTAPDDRGHRHLAEFLTVLERSALTGDTRATAAGLLRRIFEAEGQIHGQSAEAVHLHELGSLDTLVDLAGAADGLAHLAPDRVVGSAVNVGSGSVEAEHGLLAIPAPATALLLRGVPTFSDGAGFERTTPTGAALTALVDDFTGWPAFTPERVGYGLGSADPQEGRPNALRLVLGSAPDTAATDPADTIDAAATPGAEPLLIVEATLDDLPPEIAPHLVERLLAAGARDAFLTPVVMKKGRPGVSVTALAGPDCREAVVAALFAESTTLGVRITEASREVRERRLVRVRTPWGEVGLKLGLAGGRVVNRAPEFEDCRRLAEESGAPLKEIYREALAASIPGDAGAE